MANQPYGTPRPRHPNVQWTPSRNSSIIGKWFHSYDADGVLGWQGHILGRPQPTTYLVQLYEWAIGDPSDQRLVEFEAMKYWRFYDSSTEMNEAYEKYVIRRTRLDGPDYSTKDLEKREKHKSGWAFIDNPTVLPSPHQSPGK
jgi:hypothetical protein